MRKPRSDAKLLYLEEEQTEQIKHWLLSGEPYPQVVKLAKKEFGIECTCRGLRTFWEHICVPAVIDRRQRAVEEAKAITDTIRADETLDAASVVLIQQHVFELLRSPAVDANGVKSLFSLLLKVRDQELVERRTVLLEQKAAQAQQAEKVNNEPALTPEEYRERMREIFQR